MNRTNINIHSGIADLNQALISRWSSIAQQAIAERGSFHVALAGGSTPRLLYQSLASGELASSLPWSQTHIYFGDERCVPPDHEDSNFRMASHAMLSHVPLPEQNIHRMHGDNPDHDLAARAYQKILEQYLPHDNDGYHFDLILLGLGPDGHIASLFPDTEILDIYDRLTAAVYVKKFDSWRISITYPVLRQARHVLLAAAGSNKTDIINHVLNQNNINHQYPVQQICDLIEWHLDSDAASLLQDKPQINSNEHYDQNSGC